MALGDLTETLPLAAIAEDSSAIQVQWITADVLAFKPGAPHAGAHSLDNQVAFELCDGADDDHDGPAQRAGSVDVFPEADELNLETVELVEDFEEVLRRR